MPHSYPLPLRAVSLSDGLLKGLQTRVRERVIPYQLNILGDGVEGAVKSHCLENFRIAAGLSGGEHYGVVFLDSDLYKWLEAVACAIEATGDSSLEQAADEAIDLIGRAQCADGYINTYYTTKEPEGRFTSLQQGHELYCAGHFFEAATAYYRATGKRAALKIACRFADYLVSVFGTGDQQIDGYPGHQEVEIGLIKLYQATENDAYLRLASYFIDQRGSEPKYFERERKAPAYKDIFSLPVMDAPTYGQSHMRPALQREAVGHAVRALYMYSAMADLARLTEDASLLEACEALYQNVTERRMYITGGVGSTTEGESFTGDYDLPNDTVYGESCASVALMMFADRMARLTGDGAYYDTVERAFFNHVLAGMALSGTEFFYVGPLSVNPAAVRANPALSHVKPVRQKWFDVACCPTNIARTIMSIAGYALSEDERTLYINIPIACEIETEACTLALDTGYPFEDTLRIQVKRGARKLAIRKSGLSPIVSILVNGQPQELDFENGYIHLPGAASGDEILVKYDLSPHYVVSNEKVLSNIGKAAVMRGPIVYCAEEADNGAGIFALELPRAPEFVKAEAFSGGAVALCVRGRRAVFEDGGALYNTRLPNWAEADILLIPYYLWANRGEGEMSVYLRCQ